MSLSRARLWAAQPQGLPYEPYLLSDEDVRGMAAAFAAVGAVVAGPPALDPDIHWALVEESRVQREISAWNLYGEGGSPGELDQDTVRAQLGPIARELLAASATRALLQALTGGVCIPGWSATCLTFYEDPGRHLGPHRDKEDTCQFAMLYYLEAAWPPRSAPGPGLKLHIRDAEDTGVALRVTARPNRLLVLHGAKLTHYRPPLGVGESVSMLNGCFATIG